MRSSKHNMAVRIDQLFFGDGKVTPQNEYHSFFQCGNFPNGGIRELVPSPVLMRSCLVFPDGQCRVEQEYTLIGPLFKVTMRRRSYMEVVFQFLKDIDKGGWLRNTLRYRKA